LKFKLQTEEAKNDIGVIFDKIKSEARANGEQFSGTDAAKFAEDRLKDLGNGKLFVERFGAEIKNVNSKIRELAVSYDRSRDSLQRQVQLETQLTSTRISQVRGRAAFGADTNEIVAGLDKIIDEASKNSRGFGSVSDDLLNAQKNFNTNVDPFSGKVLTDMEKAGDAFVKLRAAQDAYNDELARSANIISAFRAKFEELSKSVGNSINTSRNLGVTPFDQRAEIQANATFVNGIADNIFAGTGAGGAKNVADLLNRFSPDQIKDLANRTAGIGGSESFIQGTQSLEKLGSRYVPGTDVTSAGRAEVLQFLSGLNVADPTGKNFDKLIADEKARKEAFDKSANIEDQQLYYLQQINDAIRKQFGQNTVPYKPSNIANPETPKAPTTTSDNGRSNEFVSVPKNPILTNYDVRHSENRLNNIGKVQQSNEMFNDISKAIMDLSTKGSGSKEAIAALNSVRDALKEAKFGGDQKLKVDANLNVTGFEGVGKDIAVKHIVIEVMRNLMNQLGNSAAEQELRGKLAIAIRQLEAGDK
jgi:hypothetical protein